MRGFAGIGIEGEALAGAAHALADELDVIGQLIVAGLVAAEPFIELLVFNLGGAGFFGELVLGIGLGVELDLALGGFLNQLIEEVAELALAAAEADELGLVGGGLIVDSLGGFVNGDLEFLKERNSASEGRPVACAAATAAGLTIGNRFAWA